VGFPLKELITEPKPREVITIYVIDTSGQRNSAQAIYNLRWTAQTDPFGVVHKTIDYPGVPVDHSTVKENHGILKNVRIPIRPHFGVMGVAPKEADYVDSIPPGYFHGQLARGKGRDDVLFGRGSRCVGQPIRAGRIAPAQCHVPVCTTSAEVDPNARSTATRASRCARGRRRHAEAKPPVSHSAGVAATALCSAGSAADRIIGERLRAKRKTAMIT
jgi:hypothetical protein